MSIEAMTFVLGLHVGDSTRKLILVGVANHAHKNGTASFASPKTIAEYADCSVRTVQRHIPQLLADGFLREGDQRLVSYLPPDKRPIVYDVAMTEETIAAWKASRMPGRRDRAATYGAAGGLAAAAVKRAAEAAERGDSSSPGRGDNLAPGGRGDNLTPGRGDNLAPGPGDDLAPRGVTSRAERGDTATSPEPSLNRPTETTTTSPSADADGQPQTVTTPNGKDGTSGGSGQEVLPGTEVAVVERPDAEHVVAWFRATWERSVGSSPSDAVLAKVTAECARQLDREDLDLDGWRKVIVENASIGWPSLAAQRTAADVVAEFVETWRLTREYDPPSALVKQVGREAKRLLADGTDPTLILQAVRSVGGKGMATLTAEFGRMSGAADPFARPGRFDGLVASMKDAVDRDAANEPAGAMFR
jgi:hypothetical protein